MRAGDLLGERFELLREAAGGGMGVVFQARDRLTGAVVAVKSVRFPDDVGAERFAREAAILAELSHPGIVRYVAHGVAPGGERYLAMEWLDGIDLARLLRAARQRPPGAGSAGPSVVVARSLLDTAAPLLGAPDVTTPLPLRRPAGDAPGPVAWPPPTPDPVVTAPLSERELRALEAAAPARTPGAPAPASTAGALSVADTLVLGRRIAGALAEFHRWGLIHRDLKPANLLLPDGQVHRCKLIDFGTARAVLGVDGLTASGMLVGTPAYMAPEQARADRALTPAVDVWALGCVLYECLTGRPPFPGGDLPTLLAQILAEEPAGPRALGLDVPGPLEDLLLGMLAKAPARRPADGAAVLAALEALDDGRDDGAASSSVDPAAAQESITTSERRLYALVVLGDPARAGGLAAVDATAERFGIGLRRSDAGVAYGVADGRSPEEQALAGARVAQGLCAAHPDLAVAVVLRRADGIEGLSGDALGELAAELRGRPPGTVLLDPLAAALLDARFRVVADPRGGVLAGAREVDAPRMLLGRPSAWVGRRRQLATLQFVLEECLEEPRAQAVVVTDPAGIGKSRLKREFLRVAEAADRTVEMMYGQGESLSAGAPFVMIAPALRRADGPCVAWPAGCRRFTACDDAVADDDGGCAAGPRGGAGAALAVAWLAARRRRRRRGATG